MVHDPFLGKSAGVSMVLLGVILLSVIPTMNVAADLTGNSDASIKGGEIAEKEYSIELDIPEEREESLPPQVTESLQHPRKFFSGHDIKVVEKVPKKEPFPSKIKFSRIDPMTKKIVSGQEVTVGEQGAGFFVVTIPIHVETGDYVIEFERSGSSIAVPISIEGLGTQATPKSLPSGGSGLEGITHRTTEIECGDCYWESVIGVNPLNEDEGHIKGALSARLLQTNNAWESVVQTNINANQEFVSAGDPEIAFTKEGNLKIVGLVIDPRGPLHDNGFTGALYEERFPHEFPPTFTQTILEPIPDPNTPHPGVILDYPKFAIDNDPLSPYFNSVYAFAHVQKLWQGGPEYSWEATLYTIRNEVITQNPLMDLGLSPGSRTANSALVAKDGVLVYTEGLDWSDNRASMVYSLDGGESFHKVNAPAASSAATYPPRISTTSDRYWWVIEYPRLASDGTGRVYAVWYQNKDITPGSPGEASEFYGHDMDVFVSTSDDNGLTWNEPVKVNDDDSGGDQLMPSIAVDENGVIYVAFLDHRENQDIAQYDVYLSYSKDGGRTFSRNVRINEVSIPNPVGGRNPGDYMQLVAVGPTKIFVQYPRTNPNPTDPLVDYINGIDVTVIDKAEFIRERAFCTNHSLRGDVNNDGSINIADVQLANRVVVGLDPEPSNLCCIDAAPREGGNGMVTISDVVMILRAAVGLENLGSCS